MSDLSKVYGDVNQSIVAGDPNDPLKYPTMDPNYESSKNDTTLSEAEKNI